MSSPSENRRSSATTPEMGKSEETYDPSLETVPHNSQSPTFDGDQRNLQLKNDLALVCIPQARADKGSSFSHHPNEYNVHLRLKQTLSYIISTYTTEMRSTQAAGQMVIKAEPISCVRSVQEENLKRKRVATTPVGEIVVESFMLPQYLRLDCLDLENGLIFVCGIWLQLLPFDEELYASIVHRTRKYSFAQRLRGWKLERRQRSTLMCDMYYRHQESNMFFRSNTEVVNFILYEAKPQDKRTTKRKARRIADSAETSEQGMKRLTTPRMRRGQQEADHCESSHGGNEYSIGSVVQAAVALLQLSLYEQIHTGTSAPPTAVSHEPEREWNQAILIPLNGHTNNNPDVSHPVDAEPNPSPDQQEYRPENQDVNPPVESTEPNPKAPADGLNASDQAEPNGGDEEVVRKVKANDTTTVDEDENLFEGLKQDWKIIPDLNSPVDSTEPNPRAPVDGLNAGDQAEPNGGDEEGFKTAEANDPTTVDEDENLFEELGPLDGRLFYLPEL
ncbi:hypothetical protein Pyn_03411 [Prunus yedoensis var. nudiflora]|uniref:Uncharacterized protein n=1 Tax=Prunus yedoensis var. nudiflora TaxID=2094558 RepID=A0A314YN49_PRUYE|nr:hypothetical protein Pyn_03411 [Prunus yedoensis var. nudiflora]